MNKQEVDPQPAFRNEVLQMDNKHVPFKQSRIFVTPILLFITGTITAFLPDVNWWFLAINLSLCVASGVAYYFLWRRFNKQSKRYFSLMSYIMLVVMGIHTALPFLRAVYGTVAFVLGIIIVLLMVVLPHVHLEKIAYGMINPSKSKVGKLFFLFCFVIFLLAPFVFFSIRTLSEKAMVPVLAFMLMVGLFFLLIAPVMLVKPDRIDEMK